MRGSPAKGRGRRRQLTEEQFGEESFELDTFVESLSRRLVHDTVRQEHGAEPSFEIEAFRQVFEEAVADLRLLEGVFLRRLDQALDSCKSAEQKFKTQTQFLLKVQNDCAQQLELMDTKMADTTAAATSIGERLSIASAQRESVEAAVEVIRYFEELNEDRCSSLVFVDPQRIHEREAVLKNLRMITSGMRDNDPRTNVGKAQVETQCRQLEKQLLDRFRLAVRKNDVREMESFALSMFDFDGGEACVAAYLEEAFNMGKMPKELASGKVEAGLRKFFMQVFAALEREQQIVQAVFPDYQSVLNTILEKIFEWNLADKEVFPLNIKLMLTRLAEATEHTEPLLYLELVGECYGKTLELQEWLGNWSYDRNLLNLDRMTNFLYSSVRDSYLEKEVAQQSQMYAARLEDATGVLAKAQLQHRLEKQRQFLTWEDEAETAPLSEISLDDLEICKYVLQQNQAALARAVQLSHRNEISQDITTLYRLLLRLFGTETVLECVELHLALIPEKPDVRGPVEASFLYVVLTVNSIVLDLEQFHHTQVIPRVSASSINEPTKCNNLKQKLLNQLEHRMSSGMQQMVRLHTAHIEAVLAAKQYRRDFRPPQGQVIEKASDACQAVCEVVKEQLVHIRNCLDGHNGQMYCKSLGFLFFQAVFSHLKKFSVSVGAGGSQVLLDVSMYANTAKGFEISTLDGQFANLKQLCNIHLVEEGSIRPLLKDLVGQGMGLQDIREYLETHELFSSSWLNWNIFLD